MHLNGAIPAQNQNNAHLKCAGDFVHLYSAFCWQSEKFLKSCKKSPLQAKSPQFIRQGGSGLLAICGMESAIISRRVLIAFCYPDQFAQ